jgi:hypothetical protein
MVPAPLQHCDPSIYTRPLCYNLHYLHYYHKWYGLCLPLCLQLCITVLVTMIYRCSWFL